MSDSLWSDTFTHIDFSAICVCVCNCKYIINDIPCRLIYRWFPKLTNLFLLESVCLLAHCSNAYACLCICERVHTHTHTHTHTHIYIYIYIYRNTQIHRYSQTSLHIEVCLQINIYVIGYKSSLISPIY